MRLVTRLVLAFGAVAALSVGVTGVLAYRAAAVRIPRALAQPNVMRGGGPPETAGLGARGQEVLLRQLREANLQAAVVALLAAVAASAARGSACAATTRSPSWDACSTTPPTGCRPSRSGGSASRPTWRTSCGPPSRSCAASSRRCRTG